MDSVASQPTPPANSRNSVNRFTSLFNPLRKSSSSRELKQVSGYSDYTSSIPTSPLYRSTSPSDTITPNFRFSGFPQTPPTPFGFSSNKAKSSRPWGESSNGITHESNPAQDYIPYRGPISTAPSGHVLNGPIQSDQRVYLNLDRKNNGETIEREATAPLKEEIPRYQYMDGNLFGLGLDQTVAEGTKARYLGSGLPSAYTHGGNAPLQDSSNAVRSLANQSYLPSLLRFEPGTDDTIRSNQRTREIQVRASTSGPVRITTTSSASTPVLKPISNSTEHPVQSKAPSSASSDGHTSSLAHGGSTSTSMTSLRDQASLHGKVRTSRSSHDGPPISASAKQRSRVMTSSSTSDRGRPRTDEHLDTSLSLREPFPSSLVAGRDSVPGPRVQQKQGIKEFPSFEQHLDNTRTLSPISQSTPGHTDFPPSQRSSVPVNQSDESLVRRRNILMDEANRKFFLLQQLHLDERASHNEGYLEANSNCERILMPKPSLRDRRGGGYESDDPERVKKTLSHVSFERYRRVQSKSNPQLSDTARAQSILSNNVTPSTTTRGRETNSSFFHHRMPPATPDQKGSTPISQRPDHIQIPPRRSSQTRRRKSAAKTPTSTAPSNRIIADDDDNDSIPDLATVIAQGKALEEERERWREQYRRSLLKARTRSQSRDGVSAKKVRYDQEPLPDLSTLQHHTNFQASRQRPIRESKSSPNLRKSASRTLQNTSDENTSRSVCFAFPSAGLSRTRTSKQQQQEAEEGQQQQQQQIRRRSKSQEGLSSSPVSSSCFARLGRRRRANTLSVNDEKGGVRSGSKEQPPNLRSSFTISPNPISHRSLAPDYPVMIGRQSVFKDEGTSPGLGGGPYAYRYPSPINQSVAVPPLPPNTYGIAFSAPRPDIGSTVPQDPTFSAGRHATLSGYHRPSNSEDLRSMLGGSTTTSQQSHHSVGTNSRQAFASRQENRPAAIRNDSLGMSQYTQTLDDKKAENLQRGQDLGHDYLSLPVPPRRQRSSQAISVSPASGHHVNLHDTGLDFSTRPKSPLMAFDGFQTEGSAILTPTLGDIPGTYPEALLSPVKSGGTEINDSSSRYNHGEQVLGMSREQRNATKRSSIKSPHDSLRLTVRSSSSSSGSNYSPRSVAARELWNTDEHTDEAFSSLFLKRPEPANSTGIRQLLTRFQEAEQSQIVSDGLSTPKAGSVKRDSEQQSDGSRKSKESVYRDSLQARRNSAHIEQLVNSYLNTQKEEGNDDKSVLEPAWNESSIDLHRQAARLGRVGDRRPIISEAHQQTRGQDHDSVTDGQKNEDENGLVTPRPRLDSFAASLVLTGEGDGNSPASEDREKELESSAIEQATSAQNLQEARFSDGSLADMVRDYVWSDPSSQEAKA